GHVGGIALATAMGTAVRTGLTNGSPPTPGKSRRSRDFDTGTVVVVGFAGYDALLADLTSRLTGEFAPRTFLAADLDRTLKTALRWTDSPDEHVRRLASEGTRPWLPWAKR